MSFRSRKFRISTIIGFRFKILNKLVFSDCIQFYNQLFYYYLKMRNKSKPKQKQEQSSENSSSSLQSVSSSSSQISGIESSVHQSTNLQQSQSGLVSKEEVKKNFQKSFHSAKKLSNQVETSHHRTLSKVASRYLESTVSDVESVGSRKFQSELSQKGVQVVNPLHRDTGSSLQDSNDSKILNKRELGFSKSSLEQEQSLQNELKSTRESQFIPKLQDKAPIADINILSDRENQKTKEYLKSARRETQIIEIQNQASMIDKRAQLQQELIDIEKDLMREANKDYHSQQVSNQPYKDQAKEEPASVYSSQTVKAEQQSQLAHESEQQQVKNGSEAVFLRDKLKNATKITDKFMIILDKLKDVNMRFDDSHEKKQSVNKDINQQKAKINLMNRFGNKPAYLAKQKALQIQEQPPNQDHLNHLPDYGHVFTTEGGISNNTWTAEGGGGPEAENDQFPPPTGIEAQMVQRPYLYADCTFDVHMEMKELDIWTNPINIINRPVSDLVEKDIEENIISLPTLSKEENERFKAFEKEQMKRAKKNSKKYDLTFDDQIKRLDDESKKEDAVKIDDGDGRPPDVPGPNSFITPLRVQYIEYKKLEKNNELIVKEYPRKVDAFYFVNRFNAQYTDGIEHYSADWLQMPPGHRKTEMMRGLLNEFLDEDQQIQEMHEREYKLQTKTADKMYETFLNSQEEQLYAPDSPFPKGMQKNHSEITVERLDSSPVTPYVKGTATPSSIARMEQAMSSANADKNFKKNRKMLEHRLASQETFDQQSQQYLDEGRPDIVIEMLISSIRQYEDVLYFKHYKDQNEKNKIKQIVSQLREQLDDLTKVNEIDELHRDEQNNVGKFQLIKMGDNLRNTNESLLYNQSQSTGNKSKSSVKASPLIKSPLRDDKDSGSKIKVQNFRDPEVLDDDEDEEELDVEAMKTKIKKYKQRLREKEILEGRNTGSIYQTSNGSSTSLVSEISKKKLRMDIGKVGYLRKQSYTNPADLDITPQLLSNTKSKLQRMYSPADEYDQPKIQKTPSQVEANVVAIFSHYSKKKVMPNKSDKVFDDIGEEDTFMQLPGFSAFCKEILDKVLKLPVKKRSEIYKKTCVDSKQIMSLQQFKQALTRIAREHNRSLLQQHKQDIGELKQEISKIVDGQDDETTENGEIVRAPTLEAIPEDLEEDYYEESPDIRKQQEAKLQKELQKIEQLEASIRTQQKQNSNTDREELLERKEALSNQVKELLEQNSNDEYLYDLITVEILNLDRPLTQINLLYQTQIKEQTMEMKRGSSLLKSPSSLGKSKRSLASSRTDSRLEDPKQKYQDMTQTQREFLRKKHQVMRDIMNKSEQSHSSNKLTSENLTELDRQQQEESGAGSKLSMQSDNIIKNPYMNTDDEEWFTQKPQPKFKASNLTLFMKENQQNLNQPVKQYGRNIHDYYHNLKQATGPKNPTNQILSGPVKSLKMQSKHSKVDLIPLRQESERTLQVKANMFQEQLEAENFLKGIIEDYSSDNDESQVGIGSSVESLQLRQKTPIKDSNKPPLGKSQSVVKQRYQPLNKGRNNKQLEPLKTQKSMPAQRGNFGKPSKSVQPQRTTSNGRNNQELINFNIQNAYNPQDTLKQAQDSYKRGSLPQISPPNQTRSHVNMPSLPKYAKSSRNQSPLTSTNDMKLPEIAPTQNSQSPKRDSQTLIPASQFSQNNIFVSQNGRNYQPIKQIVSKQEFRTTETKDFRITRNKGNLEYKLGKKKEFEPDPKQLMIKNKLLGSIQGQMKKSKERLNDQNGQAKIAAKKKIKPNFGMVDTNMQKIGAFGYAPPIEDPYHVEVQRPNSPRSQNPFQNSVQNSQEFKKRF